jgi:hypothetical protein
MLSGHSRLKGADLNVSKTACSVSIASCAEYIPHAPYQRHSVALASNVLVLLYSVCATWDTSVSLNA